MAIPSSAKSILKLAYAKTLSPLKCALVINSYGRSGSTVLAHSIRDASMPALLKDSGLFSDKSFLHPAWKLNDASLVKGLVYKSHDYPPAEDFSADIRMVYIFADPVDVVFSLEKCKRVFGDLWIQKHFENLGVPSADFGRIYESDQLALEKHMDSWLAEKRFPIAYVRYEDLWNHEPELSEFLGVEIKLPPFKQRDAKELRDADKAAQLEQTYASLREKVRNVQSYFTNNVQ